MSQHFSHRFNPYININLLLNEREGSYLVYQCIKDLSMSQVEEFLLSSDGT